MVGLIILGIIVLIITAVMLIPIGVDASYIEEQFSLAVRADGLSIPLIPKPEPSPEDIIKEKEKKAKREERKRKRLEKKEAREKSKPPKEKKKPKLDFSFEEIIALLKTVLRGFGKFGRSVNVNRFMLLFTAGGKDPYNTAMMLGYVNAGISALAPLCSERFNVSDCHIRTDADFTLDKPVLDFAIVITIRISRIFGMVFSILYGALWILVKNKLRKLWARITGKNKEKTVESPEVSFDNTLTVNSL